MIIYNLHSTCLLFSLRTFTFFLFRISLIVLFVIVILLIRNFFLLCWNDGLHHFAEERLVLLALVVILLILIELSWRLHFVLDRALNVKTKVTIWKQVDRQWVKSRLLMPQVELELFKFLIEVEMLQEYNCLSVGGNQVPSLVFKVRIIVSSTEVAFSVGFCLNHNFECVICGNLAVGFGLYEWV